MRTPAERIDPVPSPRDRHAHPRPRRSWCHSWPGGLALVALCLTLYLPGFFHIPPVDRDEARFAQASRQMLESGDWLIPRIRDEPRLNKPPLAYWLQASSAWLLTGGEPTRDAIWMYRVPSLAAAIATVLLTWRLGLAMFDRRAAWFAGALLAAAPLYIWEARQARADLLMIAPTVAALLALWSIAKPRHEQGHSASMALPLLLWSSIALGILAKGPITPLIVGVTALAYAAVTRDRRFLARTRPLAGAALCAAIVAPWFVSIAGAVGWRQFLDVIFAETLGRATATHGGHWGPPGYHTLLMLALFWPSNLFTAAGILLALRRATDRGSARSVLPGPRTTHHASPRSMLPRPSPDLFLLSILLPNWLLFELFATKLPHYTMPLYPALALLTARALLLVHRSAPLASDRCIRLAAVPWLAAGAALLAVAALAARGTLIDTDILPPQPARILAAITAALAAGALALVIAGRTAVVRRYLRAQAAMTIAAAVAFASILQFLVPPAFSFSHRIAAALAAAELDPAGPIALTGHDADSLVFLTRGRARPVPPDQLAPFLAAHPGAPIIINDDLARTIDPDHIGGRRTAAHLSGLDIARARVRHVRVLVPE